MKNIPYFNFVKTLAVFMLPFLFSACETIDEDPTNKEILEDHSEFNSKIIPGLGNVFFEKELTSNSASQLISIIQFKGDTLALLGKINDAKQVEHIHTSILKKQNSDKLYVNEIFPDQNITRYYTIKNGVKSHLVLDVEQFNDNDYAISILDYDWEKKFIHSNHYIFNTGEN